MSKKFATVMHADPPAAGEFDRSGAEITRRLQLAKVIVVTQGFTYYDVCDLEDRICFLAIRGFLRR